MTRTKRMNTRDQILARLAESGWERIAIDDDTDWWVDRHWTFRSLRQNTGLTMVLSFMVDPQYEGHDKGSAVWSIVAGTRVPEGYLDSAETIAELVLQKGRLAENLAAFVAVIDRWRDGLHGRQRARL